MNKVISCFILFLLVFSSCNPEIELDPTNFQKQLVVYGYFTPDKVMEVTVSHTSFPTDTETNRKVYDALVLVFENGILYDTLVHVTEGKYRSATNKSPQTGNAYQLEIQHPDYPTLISANDVVPIVPDAMVDHVFSIDTFGVSFKLNLSIAAELTTSQRYLGFHINKIGSTKGENNPCSIDGLFYDSFEMEQFVFDDYSCIQTHPNAINWLYEIFQSNSGPPSSVELSLCYVTPMAAEYHLKLAEANLYADDQSIDLFIEPVYLPQVVENGYGFFGTYNCAYFTLQL